MLRLVVSEKQSSDLRAIAEIGPRAIDSVVSRLDQMADSQMTSPRALRESLAQSLGEEEGRILSRQLFALISVGRGTDTPVPEVLSAVTSALAEKWNDDRMAAWDAVTPALETLLKHERVQIAAKALELAFNFQKIFTNAEILVDLRPVFDTAHDEVRGMLVTHKLRLHLSTESGRESHTIAMDEKDVKRLHKSCSDALKKASQAKAFIGKNCNIETFIVGDEFYE